MNADRPPIQATHEGKPLTLKSHAMCAVYDPKDGRILHMHEIMRWPGAREMSQDIEARALDLAAKFGHETSRLKTLRLEPSTVDRTKRYRIDPNALRLIELEQPAASLVDFIAAARKRQAPRRKAPRAGRKRIGRKTVKRRRK